MVQRKAKRGEKYILPIKKTRFWQGKLSCASLQAIVLGLEGYFYALEYMRSAANPKQRI